MAESTNHLFYYFPHQQKNLKPLNLNSDSWRKTIHKKSAYLRRVFSWINNTTHRKSMLKTINNNFIWTIMKTLILAITTSIALFSSFSSVAETTKTLPIIEQQTQVAGFYQHQVGNTQITALLDGTTSCRQNYFKTLQKKKYMKF